MVEPAPSKFSLSDDDRGLRTRMLAVSAAFIVLFVLGVLILRSRTERRRIANTVVRQSQQADGRLSESLLASAIQTLDHLDEFNSREMVQRVIERLNQWLRLQPLTGNWSPDPMLAELPDDLRNLPLARRVSEMRLTETDGVHLQEALTFRALSQHVRGDQSDDLARAEKLFDWVIRNIQLDPPPDAAPRPAHSPAQILFFGHGTVADRVWTFISLVRQQNLDAMLLQPIAADLSAPTSLVALLADGQLYLFDAELGLAIPGPGGQGVATLEQAATDDGLLRQMDLDAERQYPWRAQDLASCRALLEASPNLLSRRMQVIEANLAGEDRLILSASPALVREKLRTNRQISEVQLWRHPFDTIWRANQRSTLEASFQESLRYSAELVPEKWAEFRRAVGLLSSARLAHLKSPLSGPTPANDMYQACRPPTIDVLSTSELNPQLQQMVLAAKQDATYWLGLLAFDRGELGVAEDYLLRRYLEKWSDGPWTAGARYNLARVRESQGQIDRAVALLENDKSPQRHGNLLRARWLRDKGAAEAATGAETPPGAPAIPAPANESE